MKKISDYLFYGFLVIFIIWSGWFCSYFINKNVSLQETSPITIEEISVIDAVITIDKTCKTYIKMADDVIIFTDIAAYKQLASEVGNNVKIGYFVEDNEYVFAGIYV